VVEETLRCWGPVDFIGRRTAREDVEVGGTVIAKGEEATASLASANRDPERFANPEVFDITRPDANRHVAFGKGIHVCLGAPLARVEGQVASPVNGFIYDPGGITVHYLGAGRRFRVPVSLCLRRPTS
jgi:cytochrome P450